MKTLLALEVEFAFLTYSPDEFQRCVRHLHEPFLARFNWTVRQLELWVDVVRYLMLHKRECAVDLDHQMDYFLKPALAIRDKRMQISLTDAKAHLTELVRRAEAGDEIVLTRHGRAAVRLVPIAPTVDMASRRLLLETLREAAAAKATSGPDAARSQDYLYDKDGLPG